MGEGCNLDAKGFVSRLEYIKNNCLRREILMRLLSKGRLNCYQ